MFISLQVRHCWLMINGFCQIKTMVCVLWPFSFRIWCGPRPTLCCLVGSVFCAAGIHSLFLITHEVVPVPTLQFESALPSVVPSFACFRIATTFRMRLSNAIWASSLERPYYWVQMSATIVLPIMVMMVCTALVVSRFTLKVSREWAWRCYREWARDLA